MTVELNDEATLPADLVDRLRELFANTTGVGTAVGGWAAASAGGTARHENQDAWGQRDDTFVVADGMGGRPGGSVAATAAVAAALDAFGAALTLHPLDWSTRMARVNDAVINAGRRAGHDRVGAAIAIVRCLRDRVAISHVGDVRIYRLRHGEAQLLTRDHNVGAEINSAGRDPESLASAAGKAAALTSFLGSATSWHRHSLRVLDAQRGDRLVVCTDGVHRHLHRHDWGALSPERDAQALVDSLVERALTARSTDDRTALVISLGPGT
jgi:serine/threonine protein phosphatase PrpC